MILLGSPEIRSAVWYLQRGHTAERTAEQIRRNHTHLSAVQARAVVGLAIQGLEAGRALQLMLQSTPISPPDNTKLSLDSHPEADTTNT